MFSPFPAFRVFCHQLSLSKFLWATDQNDIVCDSEIWGESRSLAISVGPEPYSEYRSGLITAIRNVLGTIEFSVVLEMQSWLEVTQYTTTVLQPQAVLPPINI